MCLGTIGVYVEEGPDRDALTEALARENYLPVYLDPRTVCTHTRTLALVPTASSSSAVLSAWLLHGIVHCGRCC